MPKWVTPSSDSISINRMVTLDDYGERGGKITWSTGPSGSPPSVQGVNGTWNPWPMPDDTAFYFNSDYNGYTGNIWCNDALVRTATPSISLWFVNQGATESYPVRTLFSIYNAGRGYYLQLVWVAGVRYIRWWDGGGSGDSPRTIDYAYDPQTEGYYCHVQVDLDEDALRIYLKGDLIIEDAGRSLVYTGSDTLCVGALYDSGTGIISGGFGGNIGDFNLRSKPQSRWEAHTSWEALTNPPYGFGLEVESVSVWNFTYWTGYYQWYKDDTGSHALSGYGSLQHPFGPIGRWSNSTVEYESYFYAPYHADFSVQQDFTVELWFQPHLVDTGLHYIMAKMNHGGPGMYLIQTAGDASNLEFGLTDGVNTASVQSGSGYLSVYDWHSVACVFTAADKKVTLYLDGTAVGSNANASLNLVTADPALGLFFAGDATRVTAYRFVGRYGSVRYSNIAKTPKAIYDEYHGTDITEDA